MSVFRKIRSSRNSVVVKDELALSDFDAVNVRTDDSITEPHSILGLHVTPRRWPIN